MVKIFRNINAHTLYSNIRGINSLIRFRLSAHWLPIEKTDYVLSVKHVWEMKYMHLWNAKSDELKNIRSAYLPKIKTLLPHLESMAEIQQFYCLMKCSNMLIVPLVAKWVDLCNNKFKI